MAVIQSIDGAARRVYLHADTVDASWEPVELYREYRALRRTDETLRRYDALLLMEGNIPKGGGKATPRYMLLLDGTRIVPFDASGVTTVAGEIITDDQAEPFDFTSLTQPMVVDKQPTDAEIVYVETPSPIQDRLDYGGNVYVRAGSGNSGQAHPFGTLAQAVDNFVDAVVIANNEFIDRIKISGALSQGLADLSNFDVIGNNPSRTSLALDGSGTSGIGIYLVYITGQFAGEALVSESVLGNVTDFRGIISQTALTGTITIDAAHVGVVQILQSFSGIAGLSRPVLDANGANCAFSVRDYFGGLNLRNFNQGNNASFDLSSAVLQIEATCTSGTVKVEGTGRVLDANGDLLPRGSQTINGGLTVLNEAQSNESTAAAAKDAILGAESYP